jgi:MerR family transcriptional regulator, light-induced transcriptional regulator
MRYTMKQTASKTGLTAHTIRAWERRYAALTPARTDTDRRIYSEDDVERLRLLSVAISAGNTISRIAILSNEELDQISPDSEKLARPLSESTLALATKAVEDLNGEQLNFILRRCAAARGISALIETVILPLLTTIGKRWEEGTIKVGQEHVASSVIRTYLYQTLLAVAPQGSAPKLLVTTPTGQMHELGALIAAVFASLEGWKVVYLGPNTPSEDIIETALNANVNAIALSIIHPEQDRGLTLELQDIRTGVGRKMPIFVGGRAGKSYEKALNEIGIQSFTEFKSFGSLLARIAPGSRLSFPNAG